MKYYKARRDAYDYFNGRGVVADELLTEKERNRNVRYLMDDVFEVIDIPKTRVFWSFGCRFEMR